MRNMANKLAFTLIELMLVVVIIIVLMSMLFPMYNKIREAGRSTRCVANLRQLQMASMNYAQTDHWMGRGHFPGVKSESIPERDPYPPYTVMFYWHRAGWVSWYNYKDGDQKPTDFTDGKYGYQTTDSGIGTLSNGVLWAYTQNTRDVYLCPTAAMQNKKAVRSYSMFSGANYISLLGEGGTMIRLFGDDTSVSANPFDGIMGDSEIARIHGGKGNVIYVDGHIEKL